MNIYLGSDHVGVELKKELKTYLDGKYAGQEDFLILDLGVFTNDSTDYLDIEREVCEKVIENPGAIGMVFAANSEEVCTLGKTIKGIKVGLLDKPDARIDLTQNLLCFPAKTTDIELVKKVVEEFINSKR